MQVSCIHLDFSAGETGLETAGFPLVLQIHSLSFPLHRLIGVSSFCIRHHLCDSALRLRGWWPLKDAAGESKTQNVGRWKFA